MHYQVTQSQLDKILYAELEKALALQGVKPCSEVVGELLGAASDAMTGFLDLGSTPFEEALKISVVETVEAYVEGALIDSLKDNIVSRRLQNEPSEDIAKDLKIKLEDVERIFQEHYLQFTVPEFRKELGNYSKCEQIAFFLWIQEDFKCTEIIKGFPDIVVSVLKEYDERAKGTESKKKNSKKKNSNKSDTKQPDAQQEWLKLQAKCSIEEIICSSPPFATFPGGLVGYILNNRMSTIRQALTRKLPDYQKMLETYQNAGNLENSLGVEIDGD